MSRAIEAVDWKESADELYARYKKEQEDVEKRKRLMALWLVRRGESVSDAPRRPQGWAGARSPAGFLGTGKVV
jgi:hypothetical protein